MSTTYLISIIKILIILIQYLVIIILIINYYNHIISFLNKWKIATCFMAVGSLN